MIVYFNWKVKFYIVVGNCSMCNIFFFIWYKFVYVEMKIFEEVDFLVYLYIGRLILFFFKVSVCVYR